MKILQASDADLIELAMLLVPHSKGFSIIREEAYNTYRFYCDSNYPDLRLVIMANKETGEITISGAPVPLLAVGKFLRAKSLI